VGSSHQLQASKREWPQFLRELRLETEASAVGRALGRSFQLLLKRFSLKCIPKVMHRFRRMW
jgi:hypothetical protein